jgi:hypothetical protein
MWAGKMEVFVEAIHEEVIQKDMVGFGAESPMFGVGN